MWYISILKVVIPMISSSFFGQIIYSLLTIFYCNYETNSAFFSETEKCRQGILFNIESVLCIIALVFLICVAYVTNSVFYIPMCLKGRNKKIHSLNDILFLFTKIILNITISCLKNEADSYILLILCTFITWANYFCLSFYQGYSNKNLAFTNYYFSLILFWGFVCLFLGKLIKSLIDFNGTYYLFLIGTILFFILTYFKTKRKKQLFFIDRAKISSDIEYYKYIVELQNLIEQKDNSRENKIALKSYLMKIEENCTESFCYLKRYLNCLANGIDLDILLYNYMQKVFEEGLNKFNKNITITISYIYFLLKRLGKKKKAILLFKSIDKNIYSIDHLFNIYRCEKIVENLWTGFDGKNKENIESTDIIKLFDYQNNVKEFKDLLNKISLLYYDFWLALFSNNCEGKEQLKQLNDIGTKINKLLYQIENIFGLIHSIKNDDAEILKLYSLYLKNVLNDEERYIEYHNMLSNISTDFNFKIKEIDYSSYDINYLQKERKDLEYIIINAEHKEKNERKILNVSLGLSSIIGYQPHEIIGKDINILIPRLFHRFHNSMLKKLITKRNLELFEALSKNIKYYPESTSKTVYCKTKSNFLKQLEFNAHLVQAEDGKHVFIVLINRHSSFPTSWNEYGEAPPCCVLTDKNFIVQTFTADCCDLLGFNSSFINSNFEITSCILQFNEDINNFQDNSGLKAGGNSTYLFEFSEVLSSSTHGHGNHHKKVNKKQKNITTSSISRHNSSNKVNNLLRPFHQNSDKINVMKNRFKRQLIKTKYNSTQLITWKMKDDNINDSKSIDNNYLESKFELSVKECKISNITVGYYFFFKKSKMIKRGQSNEEINYYKQYVSNTIEDEASGDNKSKDDRKNSSHISNKSNNSKAMNKSSTEYANNKSGFYLSQQILNKKSDNQKGFNEDEKNNSNKKMSGISEDESKNFSFYLISGVKEENQILDNKMEKEVSLYHQILEKEREFKENNSRRFYKIEGNFIPKNCISFEFEFESKSYLPSKIIKKKKDKEDPLVNDLLKYYKKQLVELHEVQKKKDEHESDNKNEEYSSNISETSENGGYSSSKSNEEKEKEEEKNTKEIENNTHTPDESLSRKKTIKDHLEVNEVSSPTKGNSNSVQFKCSLKKQVHVQNNYIHDYYKVKFNKIRYLHFDFYKDMIVEDKYYEKISKMETLIDEANKMPSITEKLNVYYFNKELDFGNAAYKVDNKIKLPKLEGRHNSKKKATKSIFEEDNKKNLADNEDEFKKKIKESLNKEDKQKSIEVFLFLSIIIFLLIVALGIFFNYSIIYEIDDDKENMELICDSALLRTLYNAVSYFLREFTLVNFLMPDVKNNVNYTKYPVYEGDRVKYIEFMKEKITNLYIDTNSLVYAISSYGIKISDNASYILNEKELILNTLTEAKEDVALYNINTTFIISLVELNSALYNLAINDVTIEENNPDIYIFIHNYQNDVGKGIRNLIDIFIDELSKNVTKKKTIFIIEMIIIVIILIIFFIVLFISYRIIIKKKSSYIEGFYEIKLPFIRESLKNCEQFIYLLKKQKREEESGLEYERGSETMQNEEEDMEKLIEEEEKTLGAINKNYSDNYIKNSKKNLSNENNNRDVLSIIVFSIFMVVYFLFLIGFYITSFIAYFNFAKDLSNYSTFLFHLQRVQNNRMEFFNAFREYLFDSANVIDGKLCDAFIQNKSEDIYGNMGNDSYIINTMYDKIKNFKKVYEDFNKQSLCSRREGDTFKTIEECENFLDGQISYGYEITSYALLDLTRMGFNYVKYYYLDDMNVTGNLSDYGKYEYIIKDNETFRLEMFNNDTIHTNLNTIFIHTLLPFYIGIVKNATTAIKKTIEDVDSIYIIYIIIYIVLNAALFLSIWIPFIKSMNSIIYNAKKILGIIPIQILSTLSNIKKILDLKNIN